MKNSTLRQKMWGFFYLFWEHCVYRMKSKYMRIVTQVLTTLELRFGESRAPAVLKCFILFAHTARNFCGLGVGCQEMGWSLAQCT